MPRKQRTNRHAPKPPLSTNLGISHGCSTLHDGQVLDGRPSCKGPLHPGPARILAGLDLPLERRIHMRRARLKAIKQREERWGSALHSLKRCDHRTCPLHAECACPIWNCPDGPSPSPISRRSPPSAPPYSTQQCTHMPCTTPGSGLVGRPWPLACSPPRTTAAPPP